MDSEAMARVDLNEGRNWLHNHGFSGSSSISAAAIRAGGPDDSEAAKELIIDVNVSDDAAWSFVGAEVEPFFLGTSKSTSPVSQSAACSGIKSMPSITVMVSFKGKMARAPASVRGESLEKGSMYGVVSSTVPYVSKFHQAEEDEFEDKSTLTSSIAPSGVGPAAKMHTFLQQADSVDLWNCRKGFNLSLRSPKTLRRNESEDSLVFTAMKKHARLLGQNQETMNMVMIAGIDYPIDGNTRGTYSTGSSSGLDAETIQWHPLQPVAKGSSSKRNLDDSIAQEGQLSGCARDDFIPYDGSVSTIAFPSASLPRAPSQPVVCGVHSTRKRPRELISVNEDEFRRLKTLVTQMRYPPENADISSTTNSTMNDSIFGVQCPVSTMVTSLDSVIVSTSRLSASSRRSKESTTGETILEPQGGTSSSSSFARALPRSHTFLRGLSSIEDDGGMNAEDDRPFASKQPPIHGFYDQTPVRFDFKMFRDLRLEDF